MKPLWPKCQEYIGIQLTGVLGSRNRTHLCGMAVYAKAAASQTREGKTGLREQPQIKVQTRVRVSLFVREMHGPWIWPAEVAAAHVKAEVRHLATRIDGQAASCFGGLQATRIKLRRHWYCVLRRRRRWRVREPRAALRLATPPWRIGRFRTGGFGPGFALFPGTSKARCAPRTAGQCPSHSMFH